MNDKLTQDLITEVRHLLNLIQGTEASQSQTVIEINDLIYRINDKTTA